MSGFIEGESRSQATLFPERLCYRFSFSHRDIADLLAERAIIVTRESIRFWCIKFGAIYTLRLKRKHRGDADTLYIDEVLVKLNGKQRYLWRVVDQDPEVVDIYLKRERDGAAAKWIFKRLLRSHAGEPRKVVIDKLRSYPVAHRELNCLLYVLKRGCHLPYVQAAQIQRSPIHS